MKMNRIRNWFFTPRGAFVYFGVGYATGYAAVSAWVAFTK